MWLSILVSLSAVAASLIPKLTPTTLTKVAEWATSNTGGDYRWFDDRVFLLESLHPVGAARGKLATTCEATVMNADTKQPTKIVFPLEAWANEHQALFYQQKPVLTSDRGIEMGAVSCEELYQYAPATGHTTFRVSNWNGELGDQKRSRELLVRWPGGDVSELYEGDDNAGVRMILSTPSRIFFEHLVRDNRSGEFKEHTQTSTIFAVDVATQRRTDVWKHTLVRNGYWFLSPDETRIVFCEYTEKSWGKLDAPARIFVIDVATGETFEVPAPVTAYGVVFAPDRRSIFVGSNELGTIQRIDVEKKAISSPIAKGKSGIGAMHLSPNGKSLLVIRRGATVERFALEPFAPLPALPIASFLPGRKLYSWDWSAFSPNRKRVLLSWNATKSGVDYLDMEKPGVSLYDVTD